MRCCKNQCEEIGWCVIGISVERRMLICAVRMGWNVAWIRRTGETRNCRLIYYTSRSTEGLCSMDTRPQFCHWRPCVTWSNRDWKKESISSEKCCPLFCFLSRPSGNCSSTTKTTFLRHHWIVNFGTQWCCVAVSKRNITSSTIENKRKVDY